MSRFFESIAYFLYLGTFGFGGPFAIIAQMQRDLVENRKWVDFDQFRRAFVLIKAMPGPIGHQMVLYLSRQYGGTWCALVSGVVFLIPSFLMMVGLAAAYDQFEEIPMVAGFLNGIQMAAVAVIFISLQSLTHNYWGKTRFWLLLFLGMILTFVVDMPEPLIILLLGAWAIAFDEPKKNGTKLREAGAVFLVCLYAGAFIFGTGYAMIPVLQTAFVETHRWVTLDQFKDAVAFGMMTPGPVLMTVTFLGYRVGGLPLAFLATLAVFLPSFFHHLTWFPSVMNKLSRARWVQVFLVGAIAGVTACIVKSGLSMLDHITTFEATVFLLSFGVLLLNKIPTPLLILAAGIFGAIPYLF